MLDRLKENLIVAGTFGRTPPRRIESYEQLDPKSGVTRPEGTEANKQLRDYMVGLMKEADLTVRIDRIGNIFARREGAKTKTGSVMAGSHLDSVVNGGHLDGALGVFSALEAVRRLKDEGIENERPLEVVAFTDEEGSAFSPALLASSVLVGKMKLEDGLRVKNAAGQTLGEALASLGYQGDFVRSLDDVEYFVELHIEQGPVLDKEKISIGVVENITGISWMKVNITGQENHAGTTPMRMRKDALVAAAEVIAFLNKRANEFAAKTGSTVGTVGKLNVFPNGINQVPGRVEMWLDMRDVIAKNMETLRDEALQLLKEIEKRRGVQITTELPLWKLAMPLSKEVVDAIDNAARVVGVTRKRMNSGAGHDAQNIAEKVKTGMIFVPSVNGISHAPMEWTNWEDIENGVRVLTQTLNDLSRLKKG